MEPPKNPSGSDPARNKKGRGSGNKRGTSGGRSGYWRCYRHGYHHQSGVSREKPVGFVLPKLPGDAPTGTLSTSLSNDSCEYAGWKLYFPSEDYRSESTTVHKIRTMLRHYTDQADNYEPSEIKSNRWFVLNLKWCENDEALLKKWPTMRQDLVDNPEHTLACIGLAMHDLLTRSSADDSSQRSAKLSLHTIRPRIIGFGPDVRIGSIKVNTSGKLVSVRGTIIRAGAAQIKNAWCAFRCGACGNKQAVQQKDGIYTLPSSCHSGCKARSNFVLLPQSIFTRTESYQTIRLQEEVQVSRAGAGSVSKSIEVELTHEMVDSVWPGDDVTITGILKWRSQDDINSTGKDRFFKAYVQAVYVRSNKSALGSWNRFGEFSDLDLEAIRMIHSEPSPFRLLVHSLCPIIYGHELVKAAYLLGLFGGHATSTDTRAEIHVLVVGDPGIGKSQILHRCATVSPRGILVCGTNSSHAGLTVTVKAEKGGGASLEAGALVLADQGVCCIDEFDKMSDQHALLEVMEERLVSVTKAGVICTVPARTTVLAAANPADGLYNKTKTVSENMKLRATLLSRFDLVIIVLDRSNERTDSLLTAHIQEVNGLPSTSSRPTFQAFDASGSASSDGTEREPTIEQRLRLAPGEKLDLLPVELIQKYIGYARKNVQPRLTGGAAKKLRDFYVKLRETDSRRETDMNPVTNRQLKGLIRLTQARAKIDLSREATVEHVRDVLAIFRESMQDVFSADEEDLQFMRPFNVSGASKTATVRKFAAVLQRRSTSTGRTMYTIDELRQTMAATGISANCSELIDTMNFQGFLLKKGHDLYKFINE
ncbi:DNA helicase MCM8-like [Anopheles bellator]|uniref:DNA helicase MCM8-like n=1 Tax=Anopheles bellator TaxID=139047 RepID=UPI0026475274|nr:DNA helicase MCM8-like [Anopheles bellator]